MLRVLLAITVFLLTTSNSYSAPLVVNFSGYINIVEIHEWYGPIDDPIFSVNDPVSIELTIDYISYPESQIDNFTFTDKIYFIVDFGHGSSINQYETQLVYEEENILIYSSGHSTTYGYHEIFLLALTVPGFTTPWYELPRPEDILNATSAFFLMEYNLDNGIGFVYANLWPTTVPVSEPSALLLFGAGIFGLGVYRRIRK